MHAEHLIGTADITASSVDPQTKEIRLNLGDGSKKLGIAAEVGYWGLDGFISVPNEPGDSGLEDGYCQALYLQDGNNKKVIATRDNRFTEFVAELAPGDRAIVSNCDARFFLKKDTARVVMFTKDQVSLEGMMIDLSGEEGSATITAGGCILMMKDGKISMGVQGGPLLEMDENGITISGVYLAVNTLGGHLGQVIAVVPNPELPPPPYPVGIGYGVGALTPSATWKVAP